MTQTIPPFGSVEHFVERFRDHTDRLGNLYTVAFKHVEAVVADPISGDYARLGYIRNVVAAVAHVLDEQPVKPTPLTPAPIAKHYDTTDPDAGEESCACGEVFATRELLKQHIAAGNAETEPPVDLTAAVAADPPAMAVSGLTLAADQSRGVLAGTTPVVAYFSFGSGQHDPDSGKDLYRHYVTVVAPTYEQCREAMFASRYGREWSHDYLAGRETTTGRVSQWTEHEVIVAPGTDPDHAEAALEAARELLDGWPF